MKLMIKTVFAEVVLLSEHEVPEVEQGVVGAGGGPNVFATVAPALKVGAPVVRQLLEIILLDGTTGARPALLISSSAH